MPDGRAIGVENGLEQYWLTDGGIYRFDAKPGFQVAVLICAVVALLAALGFVIAFDLTSWYSFWIIDFALGTVLFLPVSGRMRGRAKKMRSLPPDAAMSAAREKIEWSRVERLTLHPGYRLRAALRPSDYGFPSTRSLGKVGPADIQPLKELVSSKTGGELVLDGRIVAV